MIDRGDIRQAMMVAISGKLLPGAGYGQFEHKADSLIANSKKRARWSEDDAGQDAADDVSI